MRIGVMGDTHGDMNAIRRAVAAVGSVGIWLHTGDFCRDARMLSVLTGEPVTVVSGNCDGRSSEAKPDEFLEVQGYRIWLTHGHRHDVKYGLSDLENWARRYEADIVVYGHTHQPYNAIVNGILFFNPGSASEPRRGKNRTCGVLTVSPEKSGVNPQLICIC